MLRPAGIIETALYAGDLEAAERFYAEVIGLPVVRREAGRHVFLRCGDGMLLIFDPERTSTEQSEVAGAPIPLHGARGPGHVAFEVEEEALPAWRERLRERGIPIESHVRWPRGGESIYVRDPAGNSVELVTAALWRSGGPGGSDDAEEPGER